MLQLPLERWASIVPLLTKARDRRPSRRRLRGPRPARARDIETARMQRPGAEPRVRRPEGRVAGALSRSARCSPGRAG